MRVGSQQCSDEEKQISKSGREKQARWINCVCVRMCVRVCARVQRFKVPCSSDMIV